MKLSRVHSAARHTYIQDVKMSKVNFLIHDPWLVTLSQDLHARCRKTEYNVRATTIKQHKKKKYWAF